MLSPPKKHCNHHGTKTLVAMINFSGQTAADTDIGGLAAS